MKKGLTIALLMVAMVALAASASAVAPVIGELPPVIIGDAGDVSGAGTTALHLLKYDNVFNFADPGVVDVRLTAAESSGKQFMSVFYTLPVTTMTLRASNATSLVAPMTDAEVTALLAGGVPAGKQINTATSSWLSLVQVAGTAPASAAAATAAANGSTETDLTAKGSLDPVTVTLFATNSEVPTDKVGQKSFVVYSVLGAKDDFSGAVTTYASAANIGTDANHDGWAYSANAGATGGTSKLQSVPSFTNANGVGFTGLSAFASGKNQGYGSWAHTAVVATAKNSAGKIYRGTFTLSGDQANALNTPGYRILFLNYSFCHLGGYQVTTNNAGTVSNPNYPSSAGKVENRLYWGAPLDTVNFGDAGPLAGSFDLRDYYLTFDIMQQEATDAGTIVLESATIEKIARPADATPAIAWGTIPRASGDITGHAFNEAGFTWIAGGNDAGTGWGTGVTAFNASAATVGMKTTPSTTKSVFQQINPPVTAAGFPVWTSNKLVRVTWNLSVSDASKSPQIRMFVLPWTNDFSKLGSTLWAEAVDPTAIRGVYAKAASGANSELASSPKTGGSILETYIYTMNAPTVAGEAAKLTTTLDIDQATGVTFPQNGWAVPNAVLSVKGMAIEVLN